MTWFYIPDYTQIYTCRSDVAVEGRTLVPGRAYGLNEILHWFQRERES